MAIQNFICQNCDHYTVCRISDKLAPFSPEEGEKKDLGVVITINECIQFKEVK